MIKSSDQCPSKVNCNRCFSCTSNLIKANYNNLIIEIKQSPKKLTQCQKNCKERNVSPQSFTRIEANDSFVYPKIENISKANIENDEPIQPDERLQSNSFLVCFPDSSYFPSQPNPDQKNNQFMNSLPQIPSIQAQPKLSHPPLSPQAQQTIPQNNQECINGFYPLAKKRTRTPFTKEEDDKLKELVHLYSCIEDKSKWYFIANQIPDRSARQCRERFQLFLCDGIRRKEKWSKEEDELLISKYKIIGPHWKSMEKFFVGRTSYAIKNRYISLSRQKKHFNSGSSDENSNDYTNDTGLNSNVDRQKVPLNIHSLINSK